MRNELVFVARLEVTSHDPDEILFMKPAFRAGVVAILRIRVPPPFVLLTFHRVPREFSAINRRESVGKAEDILGMHILGEVCSLMYANLELDDFIEYLSR